MTILNTASSWHVGKTAEHCACCHADLPPNTACWAALCDGGPMVPQTAPKAPEKVQKGTKKDAKEEASAGVSPFVRVDFCEKCWGEGKRPENLPPPAVADDSAAEAPPAPAKLDMFSFWKTTVPVPQQKKKLLVDDSVLLDVFQRMEGKNEPQEIRFRFVLALILMRKRLLKYEETLHPEAATGDSTAAAPSETWQMLPRGSEQRVQVINPHLTADQIAEVSQQLSAILAEEV